MNALLAAALVLTAGIFQAAQAATWASERPKVVPGLREPMRSPDGKLELVWSEPKGDQGHVIRVRRTGGTGKSQPVYSFGRSGDLLWSPDSRMVAITDALGSDYSRVRVFRVYAAREPQEVRAVAETIERFFVDRRGREIFGHSYAETVQWSTSSRALRVKVWAYDALDGSSRALDKTITVKVPPSD